MSVVSGDIVTASDHEIVVEWPIVSPDICVQDTSTASQPPGNSPFSEYSLQGGRAVSEDAPGSPSKRAAALDLTGAEISQQTGAYTPANYCIL